MGIKIRLAQGMGIPECKERPESHFDGPLAFKQLKFQQDLLFPLHQQAGPDQYNTPYPVGGTGDGLGFEVAYVFMPFRHKIITLILVYAQVKFRIFLYDGCIQGRQQYMHLPLEPIKWANQQAVVFPCITSHDGHARIGSGPVRTDNFPVQGVFQVYQLAFIKINIAHRLYMILQIPIIQQVNKLLPDCQKKLPNI
jgi:hypothetical protein